jgi:hypothetical protein
MPSASASSPSTFSGGHRERTAQDVHATLCALVMAKVEVAVPKQRPLLKS